MTKPDHASLANGPVCALPQSRFDTVQMAHGSGGRLMAGLIRDLFLKCFDDEILDRLEDQATLPRPEGRLVMTTDSFVVDPIFFPGGNIGELAVAGTVNDLAVGGAIPKYLTAGFILEEGFALAQLAQVVEAMAKAAKAAGVRIVTGDTKVVPRGKADKIFINTAGVGVLPDDRDYSASACQSGDQILVSGTLGDHGMAIMTTREGLSFTEPIKSDAAALNGLIETAIASGGKIRAMRDATRGGVAAVVSEFAELSGVGIRLFADKIPVAPAVRGACEVLGLDPLYVANEGKVVIVVAPADLERVSAAMRSHPLGKNTAHIGEVIAEPVGKVLKRSLLGVDRIVDLPAGELLPRIC